MELNWVRLGLVEGGRPLFRRCKLTNVAAAAAAAADAPLLGDDQLVRPLAPGAARADDMLVA